jgi:hypothetical protein
MDDAARVRFRKRVGHLFGDAQRVCRWQGAARQSIGERFVFDVLHRDEMLAGVLADFIDCADIAVVERRRGSSFRTSRASAVLSVPDSARRTLIATSRLSAGSSPR